MKKTLIWVPSDGSKALYENDVNRSYTLLPDAEADNGQTYSFDMFDEIVAFVSNNPSREEHTKDRTWPETWARFPEWPIHTDNGFVTLTRSSNSTFRRTDGRSWVGLLELHGVQYVREDHPHHD